MQGYNVLGQKVYKGVTEGASSASNDYIDGFQYRSGTLQLIHGIEGGYIDCAHISGVNQDYFTFLTIPTIWATSG